MFEPGEYSLRLTAQKDDGEMQVFTDPARYIESKEELEEYKDDLEIEAYEKGFTKVISFKLGKPVSSYWI